MTWEYAYDADFPPGLELIVGDATLPNQRWLVWGPYEGGNVVRNFGVFRHLEPVVFGGVSTLADVAVRPVWHNPTVIQLDDPDVIGQVAFRLRDKYPQNIGLVFYREIP